MFFHAIGTSLPLGRWMLSRDPVHEVIMNTETVPFDLARMFIGDAPALFYLEIVVRIVIVYCYTLLLLRWIGSRTIAQLSTVEFLLVIALGSAVGDSMFYADVPLLHALLVVTAVVLLNKVIDLLLFNSDTMKNVIDGHAVEVVRNGCIAEEGLANRNMTVSELQEMLRLKGVINLGEVAIAHIEASGQMSVFKLDKPIVGLPLIPVMEHPDKVSIRDVKKLKRRKDYACAHCGTTGSPPPTTPEGCCKNCGHDAWLPACLGLADPGFGAIETAPGKSG